MAANELSSSSCSSSLAMVTDKKKPQRPAAGGCVGIFFQLFDWNRRLAKKKLRLLAPARAKQASKKFLGNDKLSAPKLHLIDDENRGGFPSVRKNGAHGDNIDHKQHNVQSPSLVARLMGLETMPTTQKDKPRKTLDFVNGRESEENFVDSRNRYDWEEDTSLEKGLVKHELRPPKLQKTGQFDRRAVTRFGSEALQFKNVLSRSRKHQHHHLPKLVSPVKSPRVLSGEKASRWIDAATRILEPGLQATNRAKCTLTYSNSSRYSQKDKVMNEGITVLSPIIPEQTCYRDSLVDSFVGKSSCHECNHHEHSDVLHQQPNVEEYPPVFSSSVSSHVNISSQGPMTSKPRPPKSHFEQERGEDFQSHLQATHHISRAREIRQSHNEPSRDTRTFPPDSQERWHFTSQSRKPHKDERTPITLKHMSRSPGQMSMGRERMGTRSKVSNSNSRRVSSAVNGVSGAKDFVAFNRNLGGQTRSRMPTRADDSKFDTDGQSCYRQDDSVLHLRPPIRKRRSTNISEQVKTSKYSMQDFGSPENATYNHKEMISKGGQLDAHFMKQSCATSKLAYKEGYNKGNSSKNGGVISFEFSSPIKKKITPSPKAIEKQEYIDDSSSSTTSGHVKLKVDPNVRMSSSKQSATMDGDALGALLAQKLKELNCQEEDEMGTGGSSQPKRTTSVILQELIAALSAEQPMSQNDVTEFGSNCDSHYKELHDDFLSRINGAEPPQARTKIPETPSRFTHDENHFSPGSVLDASFSTESCISSSFDDNSESKMHVQEEMNCSYDRPLKLQSVVELLDSATTLDKARTGSEMIFDVINFVSEIIQTIKVSGVRLSGSKLSSAKEVLLNSELLFRTAVSHTSQGNKKFSIGPLLLHELETLAAALWTNSNCLVGFDEAKDENMLTEFLFDCMIEYLDTTYAKYFKCGFTTFTRLPSCMNTMSLIEGISSEVKSWTGLAEMTPDEIIEYEMSHGSGKWTDFDFEAFETSVDMDGDILHKLVDEIVTDLCLSSRKKSF